MLRSTDARMVSIPSGLLTCLLIFSALRTGCAMLMSGSESGSLGKSGKATAAVVCQRKLSGNLPSAVVLFFALLGLGLTPSAFVHAAAATRTILVLGDSLSAGYGVKVDATWV